MRAGEGISLTRRSRVGWEYPQAERNREAPPGGGGWFWENTVVICGGGFFLGVFPTADKSRGTRPGTTNKGHLTPKERVGVPHPLFGLLIRHSFAESISNKEYLSVPPCIAVKFIYSFPARKSSQDNTFAPLLKERYHFHQCSHKCRDSCSLNTKMSY